MDSIKIIKKYGQPGAVPAVTAYVDEPLLPKVSAEDAGKVIGVNENGELEAVNAGGGGGSVVPKMIRIQLSDADNANVSHFYVNGVDTDYTTYMTDEGAAILSSSVVTVAIGNGYQHRVCGNFYISPYGLLLSAGVCYYLNIDEEAVIEAYDLAIARESGTSYVQFIGQP